MNKKSKAIYILLLLLLVSSCQKKEVVINTINANIEPNSFKFPYNKIENIKSDLPQKLLILLYESKTIIPPEKNGGIGKYQDIDSVEIIGKNGEVEKTISLENLNYEMDKTIKLIDNKFLFLEYPSYFLIIDIDTEQITKIPYSVYSDNLSWSHKNNKFAFLSTEEERLFLTVADLKGNYKKVYQASYGIPVLLDNSWSNDDKKIFFLLSSNYINYSINFVSFDGTEQKELLFDKYAEYEPKKYNNPKLSYDSKYLSYKSSEFYIANLESGEKQLIGNGNKLVWLNDENKFLLERYEGVGYFLDYYPNPEDLKNKVTLLSNITHLDFIEDKNEVFFYNNDEMGFINYKTLEKNVFKKDKYFISGSISTDGKSFIYLRYSDPQETKSSLLKPVFDKELVLYDLVNKKVTSLLGINNLQDSYNKYNFNWSKDSKMVLLNNNYLFDVEKNELIDIPTNKYIKVAFWFD